MKMIKSIPTVYNIESITYLKHQNLFQKRMMSIVYNLLKQTHRSSPATTTFIKGRGRYEPYKSPNESIIIFFKIMFKNHPLWKDKLTDFNE